MKKAAFIIGMLLLQGFGGTGGDFRNIAPIPGPNSGYELELIIPRDNSLREINNSQFTGLIRRDEVEWSNGREVVR